MTPEEKSLLERTYKLSEENHLILLGLRRANRISLIMKISYWTLIILLTFGAFFFIQPYINSLIGSTGNSPGGTSSFENNMTQAQQAAQSLQDLFK